MSVIFFDDQIEKRKTLQNLLHLYLKNSGITLNGHFEKANSSKITEQIFEI